LIYKVKKQQEKELILTNQPFFRVELIINSTTNVFEYVTSPDEFKKTILNLYYSRQSNLLSILSR
jgi:hypothetical protein